MQGSQFSYGYAPAMRTPIDSQIIVNNTQLSPTIFTGNYAPGYLKYYVVVKGEYFTLGRYTLHVGPTVTQTVSSDPNPTIAPVSPFHDPAEPRVPDPTDFLCDATAPFTPTGTYHA